MSNLFWPGRMVMRIVCFPYDTSSANNSRNKIFFNSSIDKTMGKIKPATVVSVGELCSFNGYVFCNSQHIAKKYMFFQEKSITTF